MNNSSNSLLGKVALVTGGSRGIERRRRPSSGQRRSRQSRSLTQAPGKKRRPWSPKSDHRRKALAIQADNAGRRSGARLPSARTARRLRSSGYPGQQRRILLMGTIDTFSLEDFDRMIAINVRSGLCRRAGRRAIHARGDASSSSGSVTADRTGFQGERLFNDQGRGSRSGERLGRRLRAARNHRQHDPARANRNRYEPSGWSAFRRRQSLVPLKRLGHADEIAAMVAFVASPEASFITGAALSVDGGYLA